MITGDNMFTAIAIGNRLKLGPKQDYMILEKENDIIEWVDQNEQKTKANIEKIEEIQQFHKNKMLCMSGSVVDHL